jgi:lipid-binding SYLF domain-containing protein
MKKPILLLTLTLLAFTGACTTAPRTPAARHVLLMDSDAALRKMSHRDADLRAFLDRSHAYVVFPNVGEGGVVVGGAYGRGIVYEKGQPIGFAELNQASFGAQLGGQTFSELIVLRDTQALREFRGGGLRFGAEASGVIVETGAARATEFGSHGIAVFVMPKAGFMASASLVGQEIDYQQAEGRSLRTHAQR